MRTELFRRRLVVAITLGLGAVLLYISLSIRPGDPSFVLLTLALAANWAIGALLSGPLHLGYMPVRGKPRRPLLLPIVIGLAIGAVFVSGALVVREVPKLEGYVEDVLAYASQGAIVPITVITVVNAVTEEMFFRGALFTAIGRTYPVVISTVIYTLTTLATANPMLVFAALILGFVLGLQRRASGGILAPILTHVTWSMVMLFALPPLFNA